MDKMVTRKELRIAAKQYMAAWLASIPESEENANPLSERFEKNVQPVLTTGSRRARQRAMLYRAAAAVLAVVIAAAAFVAAIPSARAAFTAWIRTITDRSVIYTTQDKIESEASLPGIKIIYIPDGFNLEGDSMAQDPNFRILSFVNWETNEIFDIQLFFFGDSVESAISIEHYGAQELVREDEFVHGHPADFYSHSESGENYLYWLDEDAHVMFRMEGTIDKKVMLSIAEGIVLDKMTN